MTWIVRQIGLATYPLYLVHAEVGVAIMLVAEPIGPFAALLAGTVAVLLLVGAILAGEKAIRQLFASNRWRRQAAAPSTN